MLRTLIRIGVRKGLIGGSRPWFVVGAAAGALRLLGRLAAKEPEVVYCEDLEPGQALVITHLPPESKK